MFEFLSLFMLILPVSSILSQITVDTSINFMDSLGQKQGVWIEYYSETSVKAIRNYTNNKLSGITYSFEPNGKLRCLSAYSNGVKNGEQKCFYPNGRLKSYFVMKNGKREYFGKYDDRGNIFYEEIYENGKLIVTRHYTKKGEIEGHPFIPPR